MTRVSVVMLAWGDEPLLVEAVDAALASREVAVEVVLVDNGCTDDGVSKVRDRPGVVVVDPGDNLGFAAGCNYGARHASGDVLAFVNSDAVVDPYALSHLAAGLTDEVGITSASLRLYQSPELMNSAGNPVHYTGLSWAGGCDEPATSWAEPRDIPSATGAATAMRADRFAELGGFCEPMFAYCEDTDLSLRAWQHGWRVRYVPDAVVLHYYEFSRNDLKYYLLERNRLFMILTLFQLRTLLVLSPALLGLDLVIWLMATKDGWGKQKVNGWRWLWQNRRLIRERRRELQARRRVSDRELAWLITGDLNPGEGSGMTVGGGPRAISRAYWAIAQRLI